MTITNPMAKLWIRPLQPSIARRFGPHIVFAGAVVAMFAFLLRFGPQLQDDLVLPVLSGMFYVLAALIALLAWRRPRKAPHLTYWDVAGAFTLIGIFIAAAIEPEQAVRLIASEDRAP